MVDAKHALFVTPEGTVELVARASPSALSTEGPTAAWASRRIGTCGDHRTGYFKVWKVNRSRCSGSWPWDARLRPR